MEYYSYKEYDENDMIFAIEEICDGDTYFCKINYSIDYEYGTFAWGSNDLDYDRIAVLSNRRSERFVFEYEPSGHLSTVTNCDIMYNIIWR